jgi:hypothetical protein
MAFINKDPGRIICLVWGKANMLTYVQPLGQQQNWTRIIDADKISSKERVKKLEETAEVDCTDLGDGGLF